MLFDITQLALERAIEGAGKRHEALAANLANANTPGYTVLVDGDDMNEPIAAESAPWKSTSTRW